ncbi:hypothetical protein H5P34_00185 [Mycobacterium porcinum]|uniref:Uncharacterized protein n=2 Tax=Mycolicibacterium porcinum TaxID=39693 RepID=A0AAW5SWW9_9MYCO|nr:hypothetical protein [Mycolicibacterium porcinum]
MLFPVQHHQAVGHGLLRDALFDAVLAHSEVRRRAQALVPKEAETFVVAEHCHAERRSGDPVGFSDFQRSCVRVRSDVTVEIVEPGQVIDLTHG